MKAGEAATSGLSSRLEVSPETTYLSSGSHQGPPLAPLERLFSAQTISSLNETSAPTDFHIRFPLKSCPGIGVMGYPIAVNLDAGISPVWKSRGGSVSLKFSVTTQAAMS